METKAADRITTQDTLIQLTILEKQSHSLPGIAAAMHLLLSRREAHKSAVRAALKLSAELH